MLGGSSKSRDFGNISLPATHFFGTVGSLRQTISSVRRSFYSPKYNKFKCTILGSCLDFQESQSPEYKILVAMSVALRRRGCCNKPLRPPACK